MNCTTSGLCAVLYARVLNNDEDQDPTVQLQTLWERGASRGSVVQE